MSSSSQRLTSVTHGTGKSVFVGLHGWNGSHRTFAPLVDRLPSSATFISLDLPGYGGSPHPPDWRLETIADQIIDTADSGG